MNLFFEILTSCVLFRFRSRPDERLLDIDKIGGFSNFEGFSFSDLQSVLPDKAVNPTPRRTKQRRIKNELRITKPSTSTFKQLKK